MLEPFNSHRRVVLESLSNTQANVGRSPLPCRLTLHEWNQLRDMLAHLRDVASYADHYMELNQDYVEELS